MDFLGCEQLKAVIEQKVKDKLSDSNWKDVLNYTKNLLSLDMVKQTMVFICSRLVEIAGEKDSLSIESDPFQEEYCQFTPDLVKMMMMKRECFGGFFKFCILRKWVGDEEQRFEMLLFIQFKDLDDSKVEWGHSTLWLAWPVWPLPFYLKVFGLGGLMVLERPGRSLTPSTTRWW